MDTDSSLVTPPRFPQDGPTAAWACVARPPIAPAGPHPTGRRWSRSGLIRPGGGTAKSAGVPPALAGERHDQRPASPPSPPLGPRRSWARHQTLPPCSPTGCRFLGPPSVEGISPHHPDAAPCTPRGTAPTPGGHRHDRGPRFPRAADVATHLSATRRRL